MSRSTTSSHTLCRQPELTPARNVIWLASSPPCVGLDCRITSQEMHAACPHPPRSLGSSVARDEVGFKLKRILLPGCKVP